MITKVVPGILSHFANTFELQIQESTGARLNFRDEVVGEERTVLVRGSGSSVQQARRDIQDIITAQPPIVTDSITVPDRCIGKIIGQ